jgi:tetratricopeptide (TPR) repeat protein
MATQALSTPVAWLLQANFEKALQAHRHGDWAQAMRLYQWILSVAPDHAPTLNFMGVLALQKNELTEAVHWFQQAIRLVPQEPTFWTHLASAHNKQQQFDKALQACEQALAVAPGDVGALHNKGEALHGLCRFEQALQTYDEALRQAPGSIELWVNRGNSLQELRQFEAAQDSYTHALTLVPDIFEAHLNRGNVRMELGFYDLAIDDYRKALDLRPGSDEAHANLGNAYAQQSQWQQALPCFETVDSNTARAETLKCLYQLGAYEELRHKVNQQKTQDQSNVRSASIMAFVSHQLGWPNEHPFCPSPLDFLHVSHLSRHETQVGAFVSALTDQLSGSAGVWNPLRKATQGGFQTSSTLFVSPQGPLARLEQIIRKEIEAFRQKFELAACHMMQAWPRQFKIEGWFVRLRQSGHQKTHIHPQGWISGVVYLQVVPSLDQNEGAIEFGLHGDDLNILDPDYPRHVHQPRQGDVVLFPSNLFHRTIPFSSNRERMVVAFDVLPTRSVH